VLVKDQVNLPPNAFIVFKASAPTLIEKRKLYGRVSWPNPHLGAYILASLQAEKHCKSVGVSDHGGIAMTMVVVSRPLVLEMEGASSHA